MMRLFRGCAFVAIVLTNSNCAKKENPPKESATASLTTSDSIEIQKAKLNLGDTYDEAAVLQAVRDAKLSEKDFRPHFGDAQYITIKDTTVWGVISPHKSANSGNPRSDKHGKVLAMIDVDGDFPAYGWLKGKNYWIAAQFKGGPLEALMVPADLSKVTRVPMTPGDNDATNAHHQAFARWLVSGNRGRVTETTGWATCDGGTCCCTGSGCGDKGDHGRPDTLPPYDTSHPPHERSNAPVR